LGGFFSLHATGFVATIYATGMYARELGACEAGSKLPAMPFYLLPLLLAVLAIACSFVVLKRRLT
jgi:hypothetical protein